MQREIKFFVVRDERAGKHFIQAQVTPTQSAGDVRDLGLDSRFEEGAVQNLLVKLGVVDNPNQTIMRSAEEAITPRAEAARGEFAADALSRAIDRVKIQAAKPRRRRPRKPAVSAAEASKAAIEKEFAAHDATIAASKRRVKARMARRRKRARQ